MNAKHPCFEPIIKFSSETGPDRAVVRGAAPVIYSVGLTVIFPLALILIFRKYCYIKIQFITMGLSVPPLNSVPGPSAQLSSPSPVLPATLAGCTKQCGPLGATETQELRAGGSGPPGW